ncbi:MAG: hypothetical protein EHM77_04635 [Planctomycetaceae bacterium]|nr:MAG: hypothetical protein EHM77_04635 [Planctomycetaceae bacterium]
MSAQQGREGRPAKASEKKGTLPPWHPAKTAASTNDPLNPIIFGILPKESSSEFATASGKLGRNEQWER